MFFFCDLCVIRMVRPRLTGILVANIITRTNFACRHGCRARFRSWCHGELGFNFVPRNSSTVRSARIIDRQQTESRRCRLARTGSSGRLSSGPRNSVEVESKKQGIETLKLFSFSLQAVMFFTCCNKYFIFYKIYPENNPCMQK